MIRQGIVLLLLTTLSQVLLFVSMAVVARFYQPAEVGILAQVSAWLLLFAPWGALCLPYAFALCSAVSERRLVLRLSACASLLTSAIAVVLMLELSDFLLFEHRWGLLLLLFPALFAATMQLTYQQLFLAQQRYVLAGILVLVSGVLLATGRLIASFTTAPYWSLVIITLLVPVAGLVISYISDKRQQVVAATGHSYWRLLVQYRQFPLYQTPQVVLNAVSQQVPLLLFASWYGNANAGQFALALAVVGAPAALFGKVVGDWLYPRFAQLRGQAEFSALLMRSTCALFLLCVVPVMVLMAYAEPVFSWFFGDGWNLSALITAILAPWFMLVAVNAPALKVMMALQQQRVTLMLNIVSTLARLGGLFFGYVMELEFILAIWWLMTCGVVHNGVLIWLAFRSSRQSGAADGTA